VSETSVVKRFPDIASNRFWFALKDTVDVQLVGFAPIPLELPGREPPPDLRHAAGVVIGRLGQATIFAGRRRDGSWRLFRVGKDGMVGGGGWRRSGPNTLRVGYDPGGQSGPFDSRAVVVLAGGMLAAPGTRIYLTYDGIRRRISSSSAGTAVGSRFEYLVLPRAHELQPRRAIALEVVRGSRVIARPSMSPPFYDAAKQPGPLALRAALRLLGL
jgi:hypothetical protein